ncbi:MAG: EF-hand domain-containing protein [Planctomycetota bacterium]|nr:EF-hand domain-containing protein [Planctomycetota bacterium]
MKRLFMFCLACSLAVPALAADDKPKKKPDPEKVFAKLDANSDKKLSLEELSARAGSDEKKTQKAKKLFKAKDTNKDGYLTLEEFKTEIKKKKRDKSE